MSLMRNFATVGIATLLSRILGFIRDILLAIVLGTGLVNEAYIAAFRLPNLFRRLLAEGAFNSAFIPLFAKALENKGEDEARQFAKDVMSGLFLILLALTALFEIGMAYAMFLQVPGYTTDPEKFDLTVLLGRIMFPYIAFMSLLAMIGGILNSLGRFAAAAFAPALLNIILIIVLSISILSGYTNTKTAGLFLAIGVFIGGIVQLILVIIDLKRANFMIYPGRPRWTPQIKRLIHLMVPGIIAGGVTQINIFIGTIIASLQEGAISFLYYADRLYQLPLGIVGIAIGVVLLPRLSHQLRTGKENEALDSQNRSLEFSMALTLPASVALGVMATPIIQVIFQHGAFTAADTAATAAALKAFAIGLPAFVLIKVFSPGFFAREDMKTPMVFVAISVATNIIISLILFPFFAHVGIAIATSISGWVHALLLFAKLTKRGQFKLDTRSKKRMPRLIIASLIMGGGIAAGTILTASFFADNEAFIAQPIILIALCLFGFISFFGFAHIIKGLHLHELRQALRRS